MAHVSRVRGGPGRRPLTYDEVQALFDAADGRAEEIRARGRKGALAALRDAALLKTVYAYGLRRREASGLDLADLRRNPKAPQYGRFGGLFVRYGKASRGSPPRRRTVLTVPEMDWIAGVLDHWVSEVRPLFAPGIAAGAVGHRAARAGMSARGARRRVRGWPARRPGCRPSWTCTALRHSYVTHLVEFDYPERFVSEQAGHALCHHDGDLHRGVGRLPQPAAARRSAGAPGRAVGGARCEQEDGLPVEPAGADGGPRHVRTPATWCRCWPSAASTCPASRSTGWSPQPPQRLSMDTLAALCDILGATPNDLIEVQAVNVQVAKAAGEARPAPSARRTVVRRPGAS